MDFIAFPQPSRKGSADSVAVVERLSGPDWDRALASFDGACQEQLFAFARARYRKFTIEPVLIRAGDDVLGGALMLVRKLPFLTVAVTKWGPAIKGRGRWDAPAVYEAMIRALVHEYAVERGALLSILPPADPVGTDVAVSTLQRLGFQAGPQLRSPERYFVPVRRSDAELRKGFAQKWRNRLNKAEKSDLTFEAGGPAGQAEFDGLFKAMLARKQFVDHSAYETVPTLLNHPVPELRCELFLVRHHGKAVAGGVVFKAGNTATYLYGATSDAALPLSAGHFLQYNMIRWLRDNSRAEWLNLGGTDDVEGLKVFKTGLVGSSGAITSFAPAHTYATRPLPRIAGGVALRLRQAVVVAKRQLEDRRLKKVGE